MIIILILLKILNQLKKKKFDIITFTNKIRVGLGEYLHNELNINQFNYP